MPLQQFSLNLGGSGSGGSGDTFQTIAVPNGTNPVASGTDTLTLTSSDSTVTITGTAATKTVDLKTGAGVSKLSFTTIQTDAGTSPVADSVTDTLTLTSSDASVTITGTAGTDTVDLKVAAPFTTAYATVQEEGSGLTQRTKINFIGAAITAADDAGNTRTNVTLSQSPSSASVVGTGRTISTTSPISGGGDLSADRTISMSAAASGTAGYVTTSAQVLDGKKTFTNGAIMNASFIETPVTLTDAATVATDASLGNFFRVTLAGNRTLGNPTNPTDGQKAIWEIIQDGTGSRTITLDTQFALGSDIFAVVLSTVASKRDFLGAVYNSTATKWYVIAFVKGY